MPPSAAAQSADALEGVHGSLRARQARCALSRTTTSSTTWRSGRAATTRTRWSWRPMSTRIVLTPRRYSHRCTAFPLAPTKEWLKATPWLRSSQTSEVDLGALGAPALDKQYGALVERVPLHSCRKAYPLFARASNVHTYATTHCAMGTHRHVCSDTTLCNDGASGYYVYTYTYGLCK